MQNINFFATLFVVASLGHGCRYEQPYTFLIEHHKSEIHLDGNIGEIEWSRATNISSLYSPWGPTERDSTIFRCFFSQNYFNFCFEVIDRTITTLEYMDEMTVAKGDRVELFFSP